MSKQLHGDITIDISRFVSLGDNCEFGFFQRAMGAEPGALLRWAITQPEPLISAIKSDFRNIYKFENLSPSADDMVLDSESGIYFHTQMYSKNKEFLHGSEERKAIFVKERSKIDHLIEKQVSSLAGSNIFVYKRNSGLNFQDVSSIGDAISSKGNGILLVVTDKGALDVGSVRHVKSNIYLARIDKFAPYNKADDISLDAWKLITANTYRLLKNQRPDLF